MKRTFKLALGSVFAALLVAPAIAQNFPDVPDQHWAYDALQKLKADGILVGYPDGFFRGSRPASRYELAVAVNAAYQNLKNVSAGLDKRISALEDAVNQLKGGTDADQIKALQDQIDALKSTVDAMKANSDDIENLKKLADQFEKELSSMGVDVQAMKKDIQDINDRLTAVEKRKLPVNISGDINALALAGYSTSNHFGITVDGRPTGVGHADEGGYFGKSVGITRDFTVLHEGAVELSSNNDSGPKWHATMVTGNMLGNAFGSQSTIMPGTPFGEGTSQVYFQNFAVSFDTSILSLPFSAEMGRIGLKVDHLMFQRPDTTPYFSNERWDNGEWMVDGANLRFNFGKAKLNIFGGRNDDESAVSGGLIQPMAAGAYAVQYSGFAAAGPRPTGFNPFQLGVVNDLGAQLNFPLMDKGHINLAYLWLDSADMLLPAGPKAGTLVNGTNVYGGDAAFHFGKIEVNGAYAKSDVRFNNTRIISDNNAAWYANASYEADRWSVGAGYRRIESYYGAPGDWGRIGIWWNPTDIKGPRAHASFKLTPNLDLMGSGEFYTGVDANGSASLTTSDKINRYTVGLDYKFAPTSDVSLGYEQVEWNLSGAAAKPLERWFNLGFGFHLSDNTKLSLMWQVSDYDSKSVAGFNPFGGADTLGRGGLITTQISVKF